MYQRVFLDREFLVDMLSCARDEQDVIIFHMNLVRKIAELNASRTIRMKMLSLLDEVFEEFKEGKHEIGKNSDNFFNLPRQ